METLLPIMIGSVVFILLMGAVLFVLNALDG